MASFCDILDDAVRLQASRDHERRARAWPPHPHGRGQRVYREIDDAWRRADTQPPVAAAASLAQPMGQSPACLTELGLGLGCSVADVKRAFRRRARNVHPDAPSGSHAAFVALGQVYSQALSHAAGHAA